jgi:hypothetical protein
VHYVQSYDPSITPRSVCTCALPCLPQVTLFLFGVTYMSPFWNHILAKKGRSIHVRSQISWYVCSMYLGAKGNFFHTCNFLCSSPTVMCAFVQVLSSTYVPYNIPLSLILRTCMLLTYFWPSAVSPILCWSRLRAYFWPSASHHPWRHLTSSLLLDPP